jgi:ubiquinone/menaquinone biosynthesis C-methylase UbiE
MTTAADDTAPISTKGLVLRRAQARWYDAVAAAITLGRDRKLRERLVQLARIAAGESVLDVGCGTGTLALAAKRAVGTEGSVVGVDASPDMVALATAKAARSRSDVTFRAAAAERLPFAGATFDVVLSTLMLHHLPAPLRRECVREARRVLEPGGRMLAVDFAAPSGRRGGVVSRRHRHGGVPLDAITALLRDAGFRIVEQGSVGVSDLQYVLGEVPRAEESLEPPDGAVAMRSLPGLPAPRWIIPSILVVAIVAHLAVAQQIVRGVAFSAVGVAIVGLVALVLVMHLPRGR